MSTGGRIYCCYPNCDARVHGADPSDNGARPRIANSESHRGVADLVRGDLAREFPSVDWSNGETLHIHRRCATRLAQSRPKVPAAPLAVTAAAAQPVAIAEVASQPVPTAPTNVTANQVSAPNALYATLAAKRSGHRGSRNLAKTDARDINYQPSVHRSLRLQSLGPGSGRDVTSPSTFDLLEIREQERLDKLTAGEHRLGEVSLELVNSLYREIARLDPTNALLPACPHCKGAVKVRGVSDDGCFMTFTCANPPDKSACKRRSLSVVSVSCICSNQDMDSSQTNLCRDACEASDKRRVVLVARLPS